NTLETLLVSPSSRAELVAGKFLVVFTLGLVTTLLNVGSLFGTLEVATSTTLQMQFPISFGVAMAIVLATIPTVALAGAVCMAFGCLARSFRDAQNFLTPVYLALVFPA